MKIQGIKYPYQPNCTLSGNLILETLIKIARQIELKRMYKSNIVVKPLQKIYLKDESKIVISVNEETDNKIAYSLPLYSIICKGETWYESKGFVCYDDPNTNQEIHDLFAHPIPTTTEKPEPDVEKLNIMVEEGGFKTVKELLLSKDKHNKEEIHEILGLCAKILKKRDMNLCINMVLELNKPEPKKKRKSSKSNSKDSNSSSPEKEGKRRKSNSSRSEKKGGKTKSLRVRMKRLLRKTIRKTMP